MLVVQSMLNVSGRGQLKTTLVGISPLDVSSPWVDGSGSGENR